MTSLSSVPLPKRQIHYESDIPVFKSTTGYKSYTSFLKHLNDSVRGLRRPSIARNQLSDAVAKVESLLDELQKWIDEFPPLQTPQRFGNLSFRKWGLHLEENIQRLLEELLPSHLHEAIPHLKPYLVESFGNHTRMDYGTGHETSFMMFLCILAQIEFISVDRSGVQQKGEDVLPDSITIPLHLFPHYLHVTWALQDTYNLEPAGSHGVWGLDDSSFVGYVFGSSQMCEQEELPPNSVLEYVMQLSKNKTDGVPLRPIDGTFTPSSVSSSTAKDSTEGHLLSLYHLQLWRILQLKSGPFHEHSSQLYNIATGVKTWNKVNEGMRKMYDAEVLSKRVVVQHIPLGGILAWDPPSLHLSVPPSRAPSNSSTPIPTLSPSSHLATGVTAAPWAQGSMAAPRDMSHPDLHTQLPSSGTAAPWTTTSRGV